MPNLSVSVASLLSALGSAQTKPEGASAGTDNFSALLKVGGKEAEHVGEVPTIFTPPLRRKAALDDEPKPAAAHVDAPVAFERPAPRRADERQDDARRAEPARERRETNVDAPEKATAPRVDGKKDAAPSSEAVEQASARDDAEAAQDLATSQEVASNDNAATVVAAAVALPVATIVEQVETVIELVKALVPAQPVIDATLPTANVAESLLPTGNTTTAALPENTPAVDEALLAALEKLAKSAEQLPNATPTGKGIEATAKPVAALVDALKTLAQLLPQDSAVPTEIPEATPSVPTIKETIAKLIDQVKTNLPSQRGDDKKSDDKPSPFKLVTVPPTILPVADTFNSAAATPAAKESKVDTSTPAPIVAQAAALPAINPATLPQPVVAAPVQNTAIKSVGTDTSGGNSNDSGSGQNSNQPAPITSTASQANQAADAAYKSDFAKVLNQAAKASVAEQVVFHVKTGISDGSSKISIQLDPEALGKLDIKLHVAADGKTGMVITADHKSTLDMLRADVQNLMRALGDAGLQTDSSTMSFNLRDGGQQAGQQGDQNRSQAAQTYQKIQPEDDAIVAVNAITRSYVVNLADGLDIKI